MIKKRRTLPAPRREREKKSPLQVRKEKKKEESCFPHPWTREKGGNVGITCTEREKKRWSTLRGEKGEKGKNRTERRRGPGAFLSS